jgi:hypothetical protein
MGKLKISGEIIGFQKSFRTLKEGLAELEGLWPEAKRIMQSEAAQAVVRYSLEQQTDAELEVVFKNLKDAGRTSILDGSGGEVPIARLIADLGKVSFVTWFGAGFGWEPSLKNDDFTLFLETWPGRHFKAGSGTTDAAAKVGWGPYWDFKGVKTKHRIGSCRDLELALVQQQIKAAKLVAQMRDARDQGKMGPHDDIAKAAETLPDAQPKGDA